MMSKKDKIKKFFAKLKSHIFVDKYNCINCDCELRKLSRTGLCEKCQTKLLLIGEDLCHRCGRILANEADYCLTCQNYTRNFDVARSCCVYEGLSQKLVHKLKFGGKKYFGQYLANIMVDKLLDLQWSCDLIIPTPLSKRRQRARGYNQAFVLASEIGRQLKIECNNKVLVKIVDNEEQAYKAGKERELNVQGVYSLICNDIIKGKDILIIDDVLTTGATTSEIASVLYKAKAKSVKVLTFCSTRYKVHSEKGQVYENDIH